MKKRMIAALAVLTISATMFTGCATFGARYYGGTMEVDLEPGQKLQEATWKDDELWYLTRPMREGETAEDWTLNEKSEMGIIEGTVIFHEHEED